MNILLIGHACGPGMGSEPGFTWNWAQFLSRKHRVWVVCHPQYRSKIDAFLLAHPNPNLQFVWITAESRFDPWRPERGEQGIRIHYFLWLPKAYEAAERLCRTIDFDIAQHVSWGAAGAPPPLWRLPIPAVWGPIGGGQCTPSAFLSYFERSNWAEILRTCYVKMLPFFPSLRKAARRAAVVLATNKDTEYLLKRISDVEVRPFLDGGLLPSYVATDMPIGRSCEECTLLWAGRLEQRKGLPLALRALAAAKCVQVKLRIAGSGALRPQLERLTCELGLGDRVQFLGSVPYHEMESLFQNSDALLFSSLRDSFGSVVLEAMAHGLPILTLDHQGVGTFVPAEAGIKVPVTTPSETVTALARAIEEFAGCPPGRRDRMRLSSWTFAREQTWDRRAERMSEIYEEILATRSPAGMPSAEEVRQ